MKLNLLLRLWMRAAVCRVGLPMLAFVATALTAHADMLTLRDGRQITGVIDQNVSNTEKVTIRTNAGILVIPRTNIVSIEQEKGIGFTESSGDLAMAENKLERALDLYQKALQGDPGNARIKTKLKQASEQIVKRDQAFYSVAFDLIRKNIDSGNFEEAIKQGEDLRAKLQNEGDRLRARALISEAHIGLARKSRDTVNLKDAESNYEQAAQIDPENPLPQLEMGKMLEDSPTRKPEAIHLYEQGIALSKKSAARVDPAKLMEYRFELGKLYRENKDYEKAADTLLDVMREDKTQKYNQVVDLTIDAHSNLPIGGISPEKREHIISNLQSILQIKPTEGRASVLMGKIYFEQQNWAQARENMTAAIRNSGAGTQTQQDAYFYSGLSARKLGDLSGAAQAFEALNVANAATYDSVCELAEIRLEQANNDQAMKLFQRALEMDKDKYRAYLGLGETQEKLGQFQEARGNFQVVVSKDPENARAELNIARTYFEEHKWDNVVDESVKAVKILAGDEKSSTSKVLVAGTSSSLLAAQSYTLMGNANLNLQKANLARENFEFALKHEAKYAEAFDGIGRAFQLEGLHKDAAAYFDKAIATDPKNPDFYLSMGISWHKYRKSTDKALPYYLKFLKLGGKDPNGNVKAWIKECGGTVPV